MDDTSQDTEAPGSPEENKMKAAAPATTQRSFQRVRVDHHTAEFLRQYQRAPRGVRIVVVFEVLPNGERRWDVICTERAQ